MRKCIQCVWHAASMRKQSYFWPWVQLKIWQKVHPTARSVNKWVDKPPSDKSTFVTTNFREKKKKENRQFRQWQSFSSTRTALSCTTIIGRIVQNSITSRFHSQVRTTAWLELHKIDGATGQFNFLMFDSGAHHMAFIRHHISRIHSLPCFFYQLHVVYTGFRSSFSLVFQCFLLNAVVLCLSL